MQAVTLQKAISILQDAARGFKRNKEILPILEAYGRFLAQEVFCKKALPSFDNAAMDGYAIRKEDIGRSVKIKTTIFAGDCSEVELAQGECAKIMTGARLPRGADIVIPFEEIVGGFNHQESIEIPKKEFKMGANIRKYGEEITLDAKLFGVGEEVCENVLAILASQGVSYVGVFRGLKIGVFASGNELKEPWENAREHQIYNSNATMILAMLRSFGFWGSYGGILKDDKQKILEILELPFDVILTFLPITSSTLFSSSAQ